MVAPDVVDASVTTTAPFCAATLVKVGAAAACEPDPEIGVDPPPLPQPATSRMPAASAHRSWSPAIFGMISISSNFGPVSAGKERDGSSNSGQKECLCPEMSGAE